VNITNEASKQARTVTRHVIRDQAGHIAEVREEEG